MVIGDEKDLGAHKVSKHKIQNSLFIFCFAVPAVSAIRSAVSSSNAVSSDGWFADSSHSAIRAETMVLHRYSATAHQLTWSEAAKKVYDNSKTAFIPLYFLFEFSPMMDVEFFQTG